MENTPPWRPPYLGGGGQQVEEGGRQPLFNAFLLSTTGSANITTRGYEGTALGSSSGDGALAWKALVDCFDGMPKEARGGEKL